MALVITLIILGIVLLLVELLLIPGFGVAGIFGIISLVGGIIMAYFMYDVVIGHIVLGCTIVFCGLLTWLSLRSGTWRRVTLHDDITSRAIETAEDKGLIVGMRGITITRLTPVGMVKFKNIKAEATAYIGIINPSQEVEIIKIDGTKVIVKSI